MVDCWHSYRSHHSRRGHWLFFPPRRLGRSCPLFYRVYWNGGLSLPGGNADSWDRECTRQTPIAPIAFLVECRRYYFIHSWLLFPPWYIVCSFKGLFGCLHSLYRLLFPITS